MNGSSNPCTKRHASSVGRLGDSATSSVGTTSDSAAVTITRLRPSRSETPPANGAIAATATSETVTDRLAASSLTRKAVASSGRMACGV